MQIKQGQCFLDAVLQSTGDISATFEMALLNGVGITDDIKIGTELQSTDLVKPYTVSFWQSNVKEPANDVFVKYEALKSGVDYWTIHLDFVVQ